MHEKTKKVLTGAAALAAAGGLTAGIAVAASGDGDARMRGEGMGPMGYGHGPGMMHHGGNAAETALTGEAKEKAEAAALAAVPGGQVMRSEENANGAAKYEVHVLDADGNPVLVLLDESFTVVDKVEGRMGGPGRHMGTALTGDAATKAKDAALGELPGATVMRSFEAAFPGVDGAKYVVHVHRSDGTPAVVVLDADFKVLKVVDRPAMGRGGPGMPGQQLTGETATKAKAAAKAAVANAVVRAAFAVPEGAPSDAAYVVMMERRNGRHVMVLLDESFDVVRKVSGPAKRGRGMNRGGMDGGMHGRMHQGGGGGRMAGSIA